MKRSGTADLPLHHGRVPGWLAARMSRMGTAITEAIVRDYGTSAFLSRLSDPFWFQAFGTAMGMDWHSSGITTSVIGTLKRGLAARAPELGIHICGGRGRSARNTPRELFGVAEARGFDGTALVRASRLTARIDNNALADGFQIYLHGFVVAADGEWVVVQQGLNDRSGMARRYHWHSATVRDFVADPHSGVAGAHRGIIMNLVDGRAGPAQAALLEIAREKPEKTLGEARRLRMPSRHPVKSDDIDLGRLGAVLAIAHDRELRQFADLLLVEKLGARTLQTLALIAEVVHGTPTRFSDPARFAFALGGKDGHPFPVPLRCYDESLDFLRGALDGAKLGDGDKLDGFRRLDRFVREVESELQPQADFAAVVAREQDACRVLQGRAAVQERPRQLRLF